jgi:pyruvate carboxylase
MAAPINQIVATQALANTLSQRRYQVIEQSFRDYVKGLYGQPPGEIDRTVKQRALGGSEPITMRPADLLEPALDTARREMRRQGLPADSLDQVLLYVLFPDDAPGILRPEIRAAEAAPAATPAAARSPEPEAAAAASSAPAEADTTREFTVEVDGEPYHVRVRGAAAVPRTAGAAPSQPISGDGLVQAPMQGMVIKVKVVPGATVKLGEVVVVLEAMKMQNDIAATANGTVREVFVKEGTIVAANDPLLTIG